MTRTLMQQKYIDDQKRSREARALSEREKPLNEKMDGFYRGKSSIKDDADKREINFHMELS